MARSKRAAAPAPVPMLGIRFIPLRVLARKMGVYPWKNFNSVEVEYHSHDRTIWVCGPADDKMTCMGNVPPELEAMEINDNLIEDGCVVGTPQAIAELRVAYDRLTAATCEIEELLTT